MPGLGLAPRWTSRLVALALVGSATPAAAAPGDLDGSFSGDGWVRTLNVGAYSTEGAEAVVVQPDGRILVAATVQDPQGNWSFGVLRYRPNGDLDDTFSGDGLSVVDLGSHEFVFGAALQPDGGIVLAGEGACRFRSCTTLVRLHPNGSLDPSFGEGGVVQVSRRGATVAYDLALQPDGRIVTVGTFRRGGDANDDLLFVVERYRPDGAPDLSFGKSGLRKVDFGYGDDVAMAVDIRGRRIVAAGKGTRNLYRTAEDFAVAVLRRNGSLDRRFSGDGRLTIPFGRKRADVAHDVEVGRRITLGGSTAGTKGRSAIGMAVVSRRGGVAGGFARRGRATLQPEFGGWGQAVAVLDGRIVVAGRAFEDGFEDAADWMVARYSAGGRLDRSFSGDGVAVGNFSTGADGVTALAFQPDGRLLAAGEIGSSVGVARYHT